MSDENFKETARNALAGAYRRLREIACLLNNGPSDDDIEAAYRLAYSGDLRKALDQLNVDSVKQADTEMLAALEAVLEGDKPENNNPAYWVPLQRDIRAIIAKARNEVTS